MNMNIRCLFALTFFRDLCTGYVNLNGIYSMVMLHPYEQQYIEALVHFSILIHKFSDYSL